MITLDEARAYVLGACSPLAPVEVRLADARGLVAAADVVAAEPVPPFANSAMDGYAVQAADTTGAPVELSVLGRIIAGAAADALAVGPGQAVRIMTGAPLPAGADAVVMVERTMPSADGVTVTIDQAVEPGTNLRGAGEDVQVGDVVVRAGDELTPGRLGVLASVGAASVIAHPRPRVGVLSTGDELVDSGGPLAPGQIRDSNRPTMLALVAASGFEPVDLGIAPDDEAAVEEAIRRGVDSCDLVLTSGGVSMGDLDYVKVVLDRMGDMRWMQVAIKPAKPLAFGVVSGTPVVGLPGNPVSSMVSYELFARPALRKLAGFAALDRPRVRALAPDGLPRRRDGKTHFVRVVASSLEHGMLCVRSAGGQGSHQLSAMAAADGLAVLPDGDGVAPGDEVELILL